MVGSTPTSRTNHRRKNRGEEDDDATSTTTSKNRVNDNGPADSTNMDCITAVNPRVTFTTTCSVGCRTKKAILLVIFLAGCWGCCHRVTTTWGAVVHSEDSFLQKLLTNGTSAEQAPPLPRIAYITFSHLRHTQRWDGVLHPALDVMIPAPDPYYIVLNQQWQSTYEELVRTNATWAKHAPRIQPIYVDCPESRRGWSTCCKMDHGLEYFHRHYLYSSSENNKIPRYDWIIYQDDDMFIRHRELQEFIRYIPDNHNSSPLLLASDWPPGHGLGQSGYLGKTQASQQSAYTCPAEETYPWGQPVIYNRAALELLAPAFAARAYSHQCREFGDLNHDVGNAIVHWMFGLPALWIRGTNKGYRKDYLFLHKVARNMEQSRWSMETVAQTFRQKYPYAPLNQPGRRPRYQWSASSTNNGTGFRRTPTYRQFGHPATWGTEWHVFPVDDICQWTTQQTNASVDLVQL